MFTFSDISRCPGTFLFFSSSLGRSFYFSGTAPFLKVHRLPPGTRNMSFVRKWTLQTPVQTTTFSPHGFPNFNDAFDPWKSRKPKACFFSLSNRTFYLSNQKTEHSSLTLFLRAFRHLETLYILSLVFIQTGSRNYAKCLLCTSTICFQRSQDS